MRILVQRVSDAWVEFKDGSTPHSGAGLLCLVGFAPEDSERLLEPMAAKLLYLRILEDPQGKMNLSLLDTKGGLVLVPQFTLYADCRKGRRPSFNGAMAPEAATRLFDGFIAQCRRLKPEVIVGKFGAEMQVHLINDGPVTVLLDSVELSI